MQLYINHKLNTKVKYLSKVEHAKISLAMAFLNYPTLLFLDRPFEGLDLESKK